jgi:4-deoxy-L-threo-5-hexosulose-uronate ketol-isomerase
MDTRYGGNPADVMTAATDRLRADYLIEGAFARGALRLTYTHVDRMIVGSAVPTEAPLGFGDGAALGTAHFFSAARRGSPTSARPARSRWTGHSSRWATATFSMSAAARGP